ncbi:MAG TPA: GNAT family N-acetyltransferase [Gemmatimonadaceae bacterium]
MTASPNSGPLLLRPFRAGDLLALRAAIDESLADVQRWLPWGREEPSTLEHLAARLDRYARDFADGTAWRYAIVDDADGRFLGSGTLFPYPGPGALEVGYWIRAGAAGRGLATRASAALVRHAFREHRVERMELWTRPGNEPSMAVARRLGFRWRERRETSRAGAPPEWYEIFDLAALAALRAPEDPHVRIEARALAPSAAPS